eukprot:Protomagalhaensia_wolfi_Nauph_80__1383@NODE_1829_length_1318_cov_795_476935_g1429_i0_p1_GENE_NODE_1829_length_1318_cov_795_476935_g1429_i0NODE_1829_length_1318_cov_795_476935_g1429_i0_p1_ORF_typecomplete_len338_score43_45adh_short/PF00106_25/3_1e33adh_short_C2/PF13561_6/3e15KR/PF08659_10/6_4e12Epimerase/PF01370_21/5_3e06Sacchrp_dh_NADP/PF03435_18/4_6e05Sacchrp_dh_NADP/PF03435_18/1_6e04Polysacc_synt_2/PF02719_15/0_0013NmrA/PF05368_13/0_065NmrA/PF05368_13/6_7e02RmlD_sub_bind/PF04321_17/0_053NAD_bi
MYLFEYLCSQFLVQIPHPTHDFDSEVVIVTGANTGIGLEAARHFARLNAARVILAVRNEAAGLAAKADIEDSIKRSDVVEVWSLDLSEYASVKRFAARAAKLPRLDRVVCNAAVWPTFFCIAEQDELTLTVNVVSNILLALLLLPVLQATAAVGTKSPPTLVIVSSESHAWAKFPECKLPAGKIFPALSDDDAAMDERYFVSKLMLVLLVRELARRISDSPCKDVVMNVSNPGHCKSSLFRDGWDPCCRAALWVGDNLLARSAEHGSRTHIWASIAGPESHGRYLHDGRVAEHKVDEWVFSDEGIKVSAKLWAELRDKLEAISPGVTKCITPIDDLN